MKYLVIIFIIIIIIGLLANRELARDKKRIKRMMREYSFKTYSPEDTEEDHPGQETKEKKL
jgi:septin family protein